MLERTGKLDDKTLAGAAADKETVVRVHALRVLSERPRLSKPQHKLAIEALKDANAHVRRAAADALGQHPNPANLRPLLDLRHAVPAADTHLLHVVRMALRNQLRSEAHWPFPLTDWTEHDESVIADVALGVASAESARFLLEHLRAKRSDGESLHMVHHIARHGSAGQRQPCWPSRRQQPTDLERQAALVRAIERGTASAAAG